MLCILTAIDFQTTIALTIIDDSLTKESACIFMPARLLIWWVLLNAILISITIVYIILRVHGIRTNKGILRGEVYGLFSIEFLKFVFENKEHAMEGCDYGILIFN